MAKKTFDPLLVSKALARGSAEARSEPVHSSAPAPAPEPEEEPAPEVKAKPGRKQLDKVSLTVYITRDLRFALDQYNVEYRRTNPSAAGLDPRLGGAMEQLLRKSLGMPPL